MPPISLAAGRKIEDEVVQGNGRRIRCQYRGAAWEGIIFNNQRGSIDEGQYLRSDQRFYAGSRKTPGGLGRVGNGARAPFYADSDFFKKADALVCRRRVVVFLFRRYRAKPTRHPHWPGYDPAGPKHRS